MMPGGMMMKDSEMKSMMKKSGRKEDVGSMVKKLRAKKKKRYA